MSRSRVRRCHRAFTIVELLIAVGIIFVLAGLLFPAFGSARERGQESVCMGQLRQIGHAFDMYLSDYDSHRPSYIHQLHPIYISDSRLFVCPRDMWTDRGGWAWSAWGQYGFAGVDWPTPVSYGYLWHAGSTDTLRDRDWLDTQRSSTVAGYAVCVLHGQPCTPSFMEGEAPWYQGLTLRLTFDGAVVRRQIRYAPGEGCFSIPKLRSE